VAGAARMEEGLAQLGVGDALHTASREAAGEGLGRMVEGASQIGVSVALKTQ